MRHSASRQNHCAITAVTGAFSLLVITSAAAATAPPPSANSSASPAVSLSAGDIPNPSYGGIANVICTKPPLNCQAANQVDGRSSVRSLNRRVADDFRPAASGNITSICYWGLYGSATCHLDTGDNFIVKYYADNAGIPGTLIGGPFTQSAGTLTVNRAETGGTVFGLPEFEYTATHAAVAVQGQRCYWIEITNFGGNPHSCNWFWETASTTNNRIMYDTNNSYTAADRFSLDVAWCVTGAVEDVNICSSPPANDDCASALPIACGGSASVDNTLATTTGSDPPFSCRTGGAAQGVGTLWFSFEASGPSAEIRTCGSASTNTLLAAYSGSCANLVQIGCNDNSDQCAPGSLRSTLCLSGLTPGNTYRIQAASFDSASRGVITVSVSCVCSPRCSEPPANCQTFGTSDAVASDSTFRSADDFTPATTGTVSGACAWGIYQNNLPNPSDSFEVRYFADSGAGIPGALLAEFKQSNGTLALLSRADSGMDLFNFYDIYEFTFSHEPHSVAAGQCYWIEIRNVAGPRQWFWDFAADAAGNGRRAQDRDNTGAFDSIVDRAAGDLAFCLNRGLANGAACVGPAPLNEACADAIEIACSVGGTMVVVDDTLAAMSPNPAFGCTGGGAGALWYKFVATHTSARLRTCQSASFGDSVLAAYGGVCSELVLQSCVDDNCGGTGQLTDMILLGLSPGQTYYVQFAAFSPLDQGVYMLELRCPADSGSCVDMVRGDSNGDHMVNNFDIDAFVLAVSDPVAYVMGYCNGEMNCLMCRNDIDNDGTVNNFDIDPFVNCLSNLPAPGQPCP